MITYRVQDVTPDLHQRLVEYYTTQFLEDETICKHLNWTKDELSVGEYLALMKEALSGGYSLVVIEDNGSKQQEIVGAGMYMAKSKSDDEYLKGEGKSFRILMALVAALKKHGESAGVAKGADSALTVTGIGMWVRRDRRRRGIAEAIIRGVVESCRGKGVPHFSAFYSGTGSQRAAAKAGLQEHLALEYAGILDDNGEPAFLGIPEKYVKVYGIDLDIK